MTAGAAVLGIAAMSGVSHAETSQPLAKRTARPQTASPLLGLRLDAPVKHDKRTRTTTAGLDLGVGVNTPVVGADVRLKARASAGPGGVKAGARADAGVTTPAGGGQRTLAAGDPKLLDVGAGAGASLSPGSSTPLTANLSAHACVGGCAAPTPPTPPTPPVPPSPPTPPDTPPPGTPTPPGPPSSPLLPELPSTPGMGAGAVAAEITPPKGLPFTGADSLPLLALGVAAVAAGSAAVAATRRRTVRES
ncbi:hypothetical protein [Actinomadura chibensis]|uniref:LPXTG cell wall anchor domain-containing protein n=1 Tax=Actinomadura chibensis TaxID=392828 RepID=A0A5D0NFZ2_9ACTN|nr:hypothetical protein [Actinomadura chibensis]TYB43307.1 hypothetical protein FXF69_26105 [Actinomadura chibensis]